MESSHTTVYRQGGYEALYGTPLALQWAVTDMCNYKCSYCFGQKPIGAEPFSSFEQLKNIADFLISLKRSKYSLEFVGGEPTAHPELGRLLGYLSAHLGSALDFLIISNGSRDAGYFDSLVKACEGTKARISLSLHTEYASLEHFIELIKVMSGRIQLNVGLMFNPERREQVEAAFYALYELRKDYPFTFRINPLKGPPDYDLLDVRYTEDDLLWAMMLNRKSDKLAHSAKAGPNPGEVLVQGAYKHEYYWDVVTDGTRKVLERLDNDTLTYMGLLHFKGLWCCPGSSVMIIRADGSFAGAECPIAFVPGKTLHDTSPYAEGIFPMLVQCNLELCRCPINYSIPKFYDRTEAEQYLHYFKHRVTR